jgi:uncharacterized protein YjbK
VEAEVKLELSEEIYHGVLDRLACSEASVQSNSFCDTPDRRLKRAGWALRLRSEGSRQFLTVKGRNRTGLVEGQFLREEQEIELDRRDFRRMVQGFRLGRCSLEPCKKLAAVVGNLLVRPLYRFENRRSKCRCGDWTLELDQTLIGGDVFHELELETDSSRVDEALEMLRRWFEEEGWEFKPSRLSKMARAEKWYDRVTGEV